MKKLIIFTSVLGSVYASVFAPTADVERISDKSAASFQRIAIVHTLRISEEYYKIQELNETLKKEFNAAVKEQSSMESDYGKIAKEYMECVEKSENPSLTEDAKKTAKIAANEKLEILQQKELAFRDFKTNSENRLMEMRAKRGADITKTIKQTVENVAKEKGMSLVFDADNPALFYAMDSLDITDSVMAVLNANQPKLQPVPTETTAKPAVTSTTVKPAVVPVKK